MHVCVYVYIYIYIYIHTCIYIHIRVCVYIYVYVYIYIYTYIYIYIYTYCCRMGNMYGELACFVRSRNFLGRLWDLTFGHWLENKLPGNRLPRILPTD